MATTGSGVFRARSFTRQRDAEEYLSTLTQSIKSVRFGGDDAAFRMRYAGVTLHNCEIHHGIHSSLSFDVERSDEFLFFLPTKGRIVFQSDSAQLTALAHKSALVLSPRLAGHVTVPEDTQGLALVIPAASLRQSMHDTRERDETGVSMSDGGKVLSLDDPVAKSFARNLTNAFQEMRSLSDTGLSAVVAVSFDELLLELAVAAVSDHRPGGVSKSSRTLASSKTSAARDYLEAHASEPIRIADLARSLGVSMRVLQTSFVRLFGCSPRTYLQRCRLRLARERLLDARPGDTVASIAYEAGFSDLSAFTRLYRETYGEVPSATLKQS